MQLAFLSSSAKGRAARLRPPSAASDQTRPGCTIHSHQGLSLGWLPRRVGTSRSPTGTKLKSKRGGLR